MIRSDKHLLIFFVDGVGLGVDDPEINPFVEAELPNLTALLGQGWYLHPDCGGPGRINTSRASLVPTDPNLSMPGRPQSATGQATILTGRNVPQIVGEHYGPKPNPAVATVVKESNLFKDVMSAGGSAALITPYPQGYFDSIESGKRLLSSVPLAAVSAGLSLMTVEDLRAGRAVSPGFTGQGWHDYLGYVDIPVLSLNEAGQQIVAAATTHNFSFFEHWPSDRSGHRGTIDQASDHLEIIDEALGGLFDSWNDERDLLIITSDHGNIEEKNHRQHSRNPVPTILIGPEHEKYAERILDLADIAGVASSYLGIMFE
jgi:2,3-bisphosphoglycerate-independent phosphoglycerate mutase